jgi:hyaluronoglucosaminidase
VQRSFACPADSEAYGSGDAAFGRANADLLDRLLARLRDRDAGARLLTVAADYQGTADTDYLRGLRDHLGAGIEVMWTGPGTESRPFSPAEADGYAQLIGRPPVVWENWTTNDALGPDPEHPARIFLGPYARRADIVGHVGGFFFNPANESDLNYLPLATAGHWMRDPAHYRPRRAFLRETRRLAGRQSPALRAFAEANYSTSLRGSVEAPTLQRLIGRFLRARGGKAHGVAAVARLRHGLRLAAHARGRLVRVGGLRHFVSQARPFLRSVRLNARVGLVATDLLQAKHRAERRHVRRHLHRALRRAARWPAESFGTRSGVYGLAGNVIDRYVARVRERDKRR